MNTLRISPILASVIFSLAGCASATPPGPPAGSQAPPGATWVVDELVAHVSPRGRSVTFHHRRPQGTSPGLTPQDLDGDGDSLVIDDDGVAGSGSAGTVELVTNSVGVNTDCPAGYQSDTFCGNVTLRQFYPRSLSHVFVQVVAVVDADGNPLEGHGGVNGGGAEDGLDASMGLWRYTGEGVDTPGVLGQDSPFNAGAADWVFANPDDADTYIRLRVVAAVSYTDYSHGASTASFVDACSLGASTTDATASVSAPFPFTLWGHTSSTLGVDEHGVITLGGDAGGGGTTCMLGSCELAGPVSGENTCLPSSSAPAPALFVFWDDLSLGSSGKMCWATIGEEPNRKLVVEWQGVDFAADDPGSSDVGSSLTFEAILSEGTDSIDLVYDAMSGPPGSSSTRPSGSSATVGVQDAAAASAASCNAGDFGSGAVYRLTPIP